MEKASTLDDIRAEVMTPVKLNAIAFGGFAAVALLISVLGWRRPCLLVEWTHTRVWNPPGAGGAAAKYFHRCVQNMEANLSSRTASSVPSLSTTPTSETTACAV
jgi:hypothetical protein